MADNIIEIKNLYFNYPDGTEALRDINMTVERNESVGIIGSNGAGKTTLLLHINGILHNKHVVKVFGLDVSGNNLREIREKVGLVFQDPEDQLFMPTIFDDVAFGPVNMKLPDEEIRQRVDLALKEVGMNNSGERSAYHLSIGEKKRVSIATVLSMNPEILIMDEPTGNLDPKGRRVLIELLKGITSTKIISSHDLDFIRQLTTKVFVLDKGRVVMSGPTEEVLKEDIFARI